MEKKKLLIAVHRMNVGGVQKSLLCALRALDYSKYDVTLYVREDRCELLPRADQRIGNVVVNRDRTKYYRKPRAVLYSVMLRLAGLFGRDTLRWEQKLHRFVADGKMAYEKKHYFSDGPRYDIAVSYIQGYTAAFTDQYIPAKKKIVFFHGSTDENHALHEAIFPRFDRIVAVNAGCRDILRGLYPAVSKRITYLENYVDAGAVRAAASEYDIDRAGKPLVLCTCGRMTGVKGFDLAVEAAKLLKDRGTDFLWYFISDGPDRETIEKQICACSLEKQILITGVLDNPYPYYACCDVYVQPSREESYGLAIKEAQILCRPVVTTATVGGKSLVSDGETGLIAEIDAKDLADKIAALAENTALRAHIASVLTQTDHAADAEAYRRAWQKLLSEQEPE